MAKLRGVGMRLFEFGFRRGKPGTRIFNCIIHDSAIYCDFEFELLRKFPGILVNRVSSRNLKYAFSQL